MIKTQLGIHVLQSAILFFKFFQPFQVLRFHTAVLLLPVVERVAIDAQVAADVLRPFSRFVFLQSAYNLALCKSTLFHSNSY